MAVSPPVGDIRMLRLDESVGNLVSAVDLRQTLNRMLGEHVLLLVSATEATLRHRQAELAAAVAQLDENATQLSVLFKTLYGDAVAVEFCAIGVAAAAIR
ncbi:MAG: hypothetical protein R3E79_16755 [Caldilineaceae bacterium]